jgi:O-antigen/teichoic acid export membrane protein
MENDDAKRKLAFTVFAIVALINTVFLVAGFFLGDTLSTLLFESSQYSMLILICFGISFAESLIGIPLVILRMQEKATKYLTVVVTSTLISMGIQLYVLFFGTDKITGIFIAKLVAPLFMLLVLTPMMARYFRFSFEKIIAKEVMIFAFPLMIASFVSMMLSGQDRFILGYLTDSREVGLYGLGYNIAGVLNFLIVAPFAMAFPVIFWKKINDENAPRFFTKSVTYGQFIITWSALALSLFAPHLIKIFALNTDYWAASPVIPLLAYAFVLMNMQVTGHMSFYHSKKTNVVLMIYAVATIANFLLNLLLIPYFKMYGSAVANFLSYLICVIMIYRLSPRYYFIKWELYKLVLMLLLAIILTLPFYLIDIKNNLMEILLKTIAIGLFPLMLYLFRFYEEIEITSIKGFFLKYSRKLRKI